MKNKSKKGSIKRLIVIGLVVLAVLLAATPLAFFASINSEWQTRTEIKALRNNLHIDNSKSSLIKISQNDRVLEVIAADKTGAIVYTLKNAPLFADPNATVLYDNQTGLIKFDGMRVSYFQRESILGTLLNFGDDDDDFDFDDDDRIPPFDVKFVEDNMYQTIVLNDVLGNSVYIVCTQTIHVEFMLFFVLSIVLWSLLVLYFAAIVGYTCVNKILYVVCPSCDAVGKRTNKHCTKCGSTFEPKRCGNCNTKTHKGDIVCGKCGIKLLDE